MNSTNIHYIKKIEPRITQTPSYTYLILDLEQESDYGSNGQYSLTLFSPDPHLLGAIYDALKDYNSKNLPTPKDETSENEYLNPADDDIPF